jgi:Rieske Fe-S protein
MTEPTRRTVLAGAAGLSATVALAACGEDSDTGGGDAGSNTGGAGDGATPATSAASAALGALTEIPVGGGKFFEAQKVVVTQPSAGQVKAFSTVCTHQGCAVNKIENGLIRCPCHMSGFRIADGSVESGPAPRPLVSVTVKVENGQVVLG